MLYNTVLIKEDRISELLNIEENYFNDVKSKAVKPAKLSETLSIMKTATIVNATD